MKKQCATVQFVILCCALFLLGPKTLNSQTLSKQWGGSFVSEESYQSDLPGSPYIGPWGPYAGDNHFALDNSDHLIAVPIIPNVLNNPINYSYGNTPTFINKGTGSFRENVLIKYDLDGNIMWYKKISETNSSSTNDQKHVWQYSVITDAANNIYVSGYFKGTLTFGNSPAYQLINGTNTNDLLYKGFIVKYDPSGNVLMAKEISVIDPIQQKGNNPMAMAVKASGNVVISGKFNGSMQFLNSTNGNTETINSVGQQNDGFLVEFDQNLDFIWVNHSQSNNANSSHTCEFQKIEIDDQENIFVVGRASGQFYFDKQSNTSSFQNFSNYGSFIVKYNSLGVFQVVQSVLHIQVAELRINSQGHPIIVGHLNAYSNAAADFGNSIILGGVDKGFIAEYDNNLIAIYAKAFGTSLHQQGGYDGIFSLAIDQNDDILVMGTFTGQENINIFNSSNPVNIISDNIKGDIFFARYNAAGNLLFQNIFTSDNSIPVKMELNQTGELYVYGLLGIFYNTYSSIDFDPRIDYVDEINSNLYSNYSAQPYERYMVKYCAFGPPEPLISFIPDQNNCVGNLYSNYSTGNVWSLNNNDVGFQSSHAYTTAGQYHLTVTNNSGCKMASTELINSNPSFNLGISFQDACSSNDGTASALVNGGVAPFTYQWDGGSLTDENDICGLAPGDHNVIVTDASGCTASATYTISETYDVTLYDYPNGLYISNVWDVIVDHVPDGVIRVRGNIIIGNNVEYEMNNLTFEFGYDPNWAMNQGYPNNGVVVTNGAKLEINNCTLGGIEACDFMWDGIEVWGGESRSISNDNVDLLLINQSARGHNTPLNNAELYLNSTTIKNAHIGVAMFRKSIPFHPNYDTREYGRAFLDAKYSHFQNNNVSVYFKGQSLIRNNSKISQCAFLGDQLLLDQCKYVGRAADAFIILQSAISPTINGNTFKGNPTFDIDNRVTAIRSYDASYTVEHEAISKTLPIIYKPNEFQDLYKGIDAYSIGGLQSTINVKSNHFFNVWQGVSMGGANYSEVSRNLMYVPTSSGADPISFGIFIAKGDGLLVTENNINSNGFGPKSYGLVNENTSISETDFYKNRIYGDYEVACHVSGSDNSYLQIQCNRFNGENASDLQVNQDLANQGSCIDPITGANNVFSPCNLNGLQINSGAIFEYNTNGDFGGDIFVPSSSCTSPDVTVNPCGIGRSYDLLCPTLGTNPCIGCDVSGLTGIVNLILISENNSKTFSTIARELIQNDSLELLMNVIQELGIDRYNMLIVPTLVHYGEIENARLVLASMNSASFADFYNLFDIVIACGEDYGNPFLFDSLSIGDQNTIVALSNISEVKEYANNYLLRVNSEVYTRSIEPNNLRPNRTMNKIAQKETNKLSVYPIPSEGTVTISLDPSANQQSDLLVTDVSNSNELESELISELYILDMQGRIIKVYTSIRERSVTINDLSPGIYTVQVLLNNKETRSSRIIVQ
jgi:hypothetical protein